MIPAILIGIVFLLFLWLVGNFFTFVIQDKFIFRPSQIDQDFQFPFQQPFEEINLPTQDGHQINALHFRSEDKPSKGVILYFHGNSETLERWGNLYLDFTPDNWDFFVMDYRGFGKSSGKITPAALKTDAILCWEHLMKEYSPDQVIIYGRSMGSFAASYLASQVQAKRLILETPFSSMRNLFYTYYPWLPPVFKFKYVLPNAQLIKKVAYPITIFQGTSDWVVPYKCAVKLKDSLKPEDEFYTIRGGTHNDLSKFETYRFRMKEILA